MQGKWLCRTAPKTGTLRLTSHGFCHMPFADAASTRHLGDRAIHAVVCVRGLCLVTSWGFLPEATNMFRSTYLGLRAKNPSFQKCYAFNKDSNSLKELIL